MADKKRNPTEEVIRKRWGLGTMTPEQDWREVPGMVDRDHLIAYQRNFRGPGDWRYEGLAPEPTDYRRTAQPYDRESLMSLLQSQIGERLPELLSQQIQAPMRKSPEGSPPSREPVKENWRDGLDLGFNMPGGTFARNIPEGEMDEDEWGRYMTLLNTLFGRGA